MPSGIKPLPESMMTQIYGAIWRHRPQSLNGRMSSEVIHRNIGIQSVVIWWKQKRISVMKEFSWCFTIMQRFSIPALCLAIHHLWSVRTDAKHHIIDPMKYVHCFIVLLFAVVESSWWRHQMETFSALLAICMGNSPVSGEFHAQRSVTRSFDVFFDLRLNKRLIKQS